MESTTRNIEIATGLRELADWIERHAATVPDLTYSFDRILVPLNDRDELRNVARTEGRFTKEVDRAHYGIDRAFGVIGVHFYVSRSKVCRKIVVGTKEVPERVVPARTEEIVEWVCDEPLLAELEGSDA